MPCFMSQNAQDKYTSNKKYSIEVSSNPFYNVNKIIS